MRHVAREIWPSTPRALEAAHRLKRTVLFSASAYGIAALAVVGYHTVIERHSAAISAPLWWLAVFNVAMLVGLATWILGRPRRPSAE
jgi:hypothetical protein